ncbi:AMIDASE 1 [Salix purpurea]|uniref:AMIDASE 1 n=1 Tax=Salix purpurea TaxID=77065 RepID=A0A9Q0YVH5_SALPP|nr:AMIDASE 1 [Salix purpurea]
MTNTKMWVLVIGVTVAVGIVAAAETRRRRRRKAIFKEDFGAFVQRFQILPFPQPPPPAAKQTLAGLTFAINDIFELEEHVTGFGNPDWARTHEAAEKTAVTVTALLKNGALCVGKTVIDEFAFGVSGENMHYGAPINPEMPAHVPGGSSSGSAVAVAAELVDFALGTDTTGCIRIPAAFCGLLSYRPSHGAVSMIGVLPNSQSLDTVGWLARDPSILLRVGNALLKLNTVEPRRARCLIFADDLFQLSKVPKQKAEGVISKAIENLSGCKLQDHDTSLNDILILAQHVASNVPSLKGLLDQSTNLQNGTSILKALSSAMVSLQRHEFKTNHEEWVKSVEPKLAPDVSDNVLAAINTTHENLKALYDIRRELRACIKILLKDNGILVIPTVADPPWKLNSKKRGTVESHNRALILSSIASMSGCCQVTIPLGKNDGCPISVSFITFHGGDKFLLDTLLDMYSSLKEQINFVSSPAPLQNTNKNIDDSELLKEKGNAAYKGNQWNKAVNYYSEAIKLNGENATYYSNRAAAYLQLGCFQKAEEDCNKAISLDKKNVKAYMRRGTARESLLFYKDAAQDFKHALVLEPQNKVASDAEKRLRKLMG